MTGIQIGTIEACPKCDHFACICDIKAAHKPECPFRIAATGPVGIECDHGRDVCPQCDPCTCKEKSK